MRKFMGSVDLRADLHAHRQMAIFVAGAGALCSVIMILLALLCAGIGSRPAPPGHPGRRHLHLHRQHLPQVLIDGMTIGFVYAAIALGYTMVYGVLQFINFAHSEIFAIGAFCGVESLIALNGAGILARAGPDRLLRLPAAWPC